MTRALAVALCLLGLLATGCGGDDSKKDYEQAITQISKEWQSELQRVGQQVTTSPDRAEIAGVLARSSKVLADAGKKVDDIDPPDDVGEAHRLLATGLRELAGVFQKAERAARRGDESAMQSTLTDIDTSSGGRKIARADELYRKADYTISQQQK